MKFTWQTTIEVDRDDAREYAESHSEDELPDDYEPTYDDYYGAAYEKFVNDDCEYDLV